MNTTRCAHCGGPVVEIVLSSDDKALTMRSCSGCDARQWDTDGQVVDLTEVIGELSSSEVTRRHRRSR